MRAGRSSEGIITKTRFGTVMLSLADFHEELQSSKSTFPSENKRSGSAGLNNQPTESMPFNNRPTAIVYQSSYSRLLKRTLLLGRLFKPVVCFGRFWNGLYCFEVVSEDCRSNTTRNKYLLIFWDMISLLLR